jgi:hypothetical protein
MDRCKDCRTGEPLPPALIFSANLLMISGYLDVALRDLDLALTALALGRLSQQ